MKVDDESKRPMKTTAPTAIGGDYSDGRSLRNTTQPATRSPSLIAPLVLAALGSGAMQAAASSNPGLFAWLRYDRARVIDDLQAWRLITGWWVHLSWLHWSVNLVGAMAVVVLFARLVPPARQWGDIAIVGLIHGVVLLVAFPQVAWVAGLSGALHGVFAKNALQLACTPVRSNDGWIEGPRYGVLLLVGLAFKIASDAWLESGAAEAWLNGACVAWQSHAAGAIAGLAWGSAQRTSRQSAAQ